MTSLSLSRPYQGRAMAILAMFTLVVMLFVSNDSPLSTINNHVDSAIFFMSGKAWANGLVPYVDFSDSKGPLLWLIEMVGYWISPTSYHGVWLLSVIVMTFTLYFCWLTAMEVLRQLRLSICVVLAMPLIYFCSFTFLETRAETWCSLPVMYGIYIVVKLIVARGNDDKNVCISRKESVGLGLAVMACLLIKWSIAVMMLSFCLSVLILCWQSESHLLKAFGWFCVGMVALALPFIAYFVSVGAFRSFVNEYFFVTASTVGGATLARLYKSYYVEVHTLFTSPMSIISVLLSIIGGIWGMSAKYRFRYLLLMNYGVFLVIASSNFTFYYLQITQSFAIFGFIWMARNVNVDQLRYTFLMFYTILILMLTSYLNHLWHIYNYDSDFHDVVAMDNAISSEVASKPGTMPCLLNYRNLDIGVGISIHTIPANKYWFYQNGATPEMDADQDETVRKRRADIIYTLSHQHNGFLEKHGYRLIYQAPDSTVGGRARLYMKRWDL